jgi:maltose-binding protein MalE
MSRHSLPLVLFMVVAMLATACSSGQQSPGTSTAPTSGGSAPAASGPAGGSQPAADISGTLMVGAKYGCKPPPCTPQGEGVADEIATTRYDVFVKQYPDVSVEFTEADFNAQQFLTAVAAQNPPDVIRMDRAIMGTYIAQGALDPLDECITKFGIDMSQYREPAVAAVTMDGSVYGIPEFYDSRIILTNDSVLDEAGLKPEDVDTTDWTKLAEVNQKLLKKDGNKITRIGFDPKLPEFLPLWAKANGASIISDDGKTSQLEDPKVIEALDYAASLVKAHGDNPTFVDFKEGHGRQGLLRPEEPVCRGHRGGVPDGAVVPERPREQHAGREDQLRPVQGPARCRHQLLGRLGVGDPELGQE